MGENTPPNVDAGDTAHDAPEGTHAAGDETLDAALAKGRELLATAEALIREKPLAALGIAFAAGFLLSRLGRR